MSGTGKLLLICHQLASVTSDADRSRNIIPHNLNTCGPLCSALSELHWGEFGMSGVSRKWWEVTASTSRRIIYVMQYK